jgi:uridine kinase
MPRPVRPSTLNTTRSAGTRPSTRPVLVCFAGGSASGKSTITAALAERLAGRSLAIINTDHYFRDWTADEELRSANRPDAVLWPALIADLDRLMAGQPVELPAAGTRSAARGSEPWRIEARDLVMIEGLLTLWSDELRARCDLAVYVDAPGDERVLRRINRDIAQRGATVESATAWYRHDVRPSFARFTEPSKWRADLIVPNPGTTGPSPASIDALAAAIEALIKAR